MMFLRLYLRITFCFIIIMFSIKRNGGEAFTANEYNENKKQAEYNYFIDFPETVDLIKYLQSVKMVIDFAHRHKSEIDMNFAFALSIVSDNYKHVLIKTGRRLPDELKVYLKGFLRQNSELLQYFEAMVKLSRLEKNTKNAMLSTLFLNRILGYRGIAEFYHRKKSPLYLLKSSYPSWDTYQNKVNQYEKWKPTPKETDKCLVSLAKNNRSKRVCKLSSSCYTVLVNGTNFGYSLTHRLLILLQAHRGRGCTIFSTREDKELLGLFCLKIFREANFIANNGYKMLDLMLEQMTLCSLAGYADTLRRSWFMEVLKHQTSVGCFSPRLPLATIFYQNANLSSWNFSPKSPTMLGGACDRHFTAVAVGALSGAVRYVMENRY